MNSFLQNISTTMKRGRVYRCDDCDWEGDRSVCIEHYTRKHCTVRTAPFVCRAYGFMARMEMKLEKHVQTPKHKVKMGKTTDKENNLIIRRTDIDLMTHFQMLTHDESEEICKRENEKLHIQR